MTINTGEPKVVTSKEKVLGGRGQGKKALNLPMKCGGVQWVRGGHQNCKGQKLVAMGIKEERSSDLKREAKKKRTPDCWVV